MFLGRHRKVSCPLFFRERQSPDCLRVLPAILLLLLLTACGKDTHQFSPPENATPFELVDPFIATSGDHGQQYPGATRPFGMVKLGPDTYPAGLERKAHSGYDYRDTKIMGFSHLRVGGMGAKGVGGNVLVLPCVGPPETDPEDYAVAYKKSTEQASPGHYGVVLKNKVGVDLTATSHVGLHRYTFPKSSKSHILIDLGRGFTAVRDATIRVIDRNEIAGHVTAAHSFNDQATYTVYFNAQFSHPFDRWTLWNFDEVSENKGTESGAAIGGQFFFATESEEVILLKVALSLIDEDDARQTRDIEIPGWDFDVVRQQARAEWEGYLNRIEVEGGTPTDRVLFYTSLYRSLSEPMNVTGPDGRYRGHDLKIHRAEGWTYYDCYCTWDTFRTKYPLLCLMAPEVMGDIVRSLIDQHQKGRGQYPFLMVRNDQTIPIIFDAYAKGIGGFDVEAAYQTIEMLAVRQTGKSYEARGYVPLRPDLTLEYAHNDWCVAQMAKSLGETEDYERFTRRSQFYRNTWNPDTRFFAPRNADGTWAETGDPSDFGDHAYEGTLWQWRWSVPHDIDGLIELVGGQEAFGDDLDRYFDEALHNRGNEVELHTPYLYNRIDRPDRTQEILEAFLTQPTKHRYGTHKKYKKSIERRIYQAAPEGFLPEMDDDCGAMSSWYVLSAMGIYPVCPGEPNYITGYSPFDKVTLRLSE